MGKKGPPITIIPKAVSDWIRESSNLSKVNNWKKGGGKPQK
ncbi:MULTISPECIES: hypothetical protein [Brevibacillus]|nr:hypothetical protein [Brevibacillus brevis]